MEKKISKIIVLTIIFLIALFMVSLKSYATGSFRLYFQSNLKAAPGETIEVPIYLDGINIEGIEKKMISFKGTIDFDDSIFELVPYNEGDVSSILKINEEIEDYGLNIRYNTENKNINGLLDISALSNVTGSNESEYDYKFINGFLPLGTVQIKVKDTVESGNYKFTISDGEGSSGEFQLAGVNTNSTIYITAKDTGEKNKIDREEEKNRPESDDINYDSKTPILKIDVSKDGKKIIITPDEKDGADIEAITYKKNQLRRENGSFVFDSEPNKLYEFFIYGKGGNCFGNEYISTVIKEEPNNTEENKPEDNKSEENKPEENEKESPQTGDYIAYIIVVCQVMITSVCVIEMTRRLRKVK